MWVKAQQQHAASKIKKLRSLILYSLELACTIFAVMKLGAARYL